MINNEIISIKNTNSDIILKTKSVDLTVEEIKKYKDKFEEMLYWVKDIKNNAVGLAFPQIGINKRCFVAYNPAGKLNGIYINPTYTILDNQLVDSEESCLSVPDEKYKVKRYKKIKIKYLNKDGKVEKLILKNFDAFIFQHEFNHLEGILINQGEKIN